ncbi:DUF305 domain-containing protein [Micromonospora sp. WMMC250]|uniref:DUF305 domain-containing protein n=1 Tax=Micromonospora sp. WMMC250 TaxID=3014781 RepID=UPI0022B718BD|nr:DUF305 domain-containing protein [Micromonospora sp. WMMC250]MCZ7379866.1 DUF305 domain-containing protein [Micromonospora sp. WMMC250]
MTDRPTGEPAARTGHRAYLLGGLAALVALAVGLAIGLLVPDSRPGDGSAEAGFARDMQTHHAQAIEMSIIAYRRSVDPEIQTIGLDVALTQQTQVGTMRDWLDQWQLPPTGSRPAMAWMPGHTLTADGRMPGMASRQELDRLRAANGRDLDILYSQLMIRHHLGGIMMAEEVLRHSDRPEVRSLAESMKTSQQNEITAFMAVLARNGAKPS